MISSISIKTKLGWISAFKEKDKSLKKISLVYSLKQRNQHYF